MVSLSLQERQERAREALIKSPSQQKIVRKVSEGILAKQQLQQQQEVPEEMEGGLCLGIDATEGGEGEGPRRRRTPTKNQKC